MQKLISAFRLTFSAYILFFSAHQVAHAEIYKWVKKDGSIVYTDNLSDLPVKRRAFYEERRKEQEQRDAELKAKIGEKEFERRKLEAERQALAAQKQAAQDSQRRLQALEQQLQKIRRDRAKIDEAHQAWLTRWRDEKAKLNALLSQYKKLKAEHDKIAIQPSHTLFPGQHEQMQKAARAMKSLEPQIDQALVLVQETLPEEARRAGIPPGLLREDEPPSVK